MSATITAFNVLATCADIVLLKPTGPDTDTENLLNDEIDTLLPNV